MSNGWYQLEHNRPRKGVPYLPGGTPRREPYIPVTRSTASEPPIPERLPQEPPAPPVRQRETEPAPLVEAAPAEEQGETAWERTDSAPPPMPEEEPSAHSQTVGAGGPVVLLDGALHETLAGFIHEKPLERAVHAKGWGAFGQFETGRAMGEYTMLPFLQRVGEQTPTVSRFSLAVSSRDTPDASRNVRGFSTKFYTGNGVFDLLCNHLPVFSVRDAMRFPEFIRTLGPAPGSNLRDPERFWAFVAHAPEALHFVTWLYSDAGTVKSLRHLRTYGVNTYVWRNAAGKRRYVKYHWLPQAGTEFLAAAESAALAGDPDVAGRGLYEAIARGEGPEYELRVQLMDPADAESLPYDPLDATKVWSEADYPLQPVGRLILNRNPENYREQVEKLAFSPANLLPGAEFSDDKLLQGRSAVYWDAQRRRLGTDFRKIPVNRQEGWTPDQQVSSGLGAETAGTQVRAGISRRDDFTQAGERYRALPREEQEHLEENIASELRGVSRETRETVLDYLNRADRDYGGRVAEKSGA